MLAANDHFYIHVFDHFIFHAQNVRHHITSCIMDNAQDILLVIAIIQVYMSLKDHYYLIRYFH